MADEASAAAAPAKEEKDSKKRARDEADEADDEMPEMPEKWAKKDIGRAMLWYYRDKAGKRQGPFYPGQMRHWWTAGFFQPTQLVAPSFRGEVPRAFVRVDQFFTDAPARLAACNTLGIWDRGSRNHTWATSLEALGSTLRKSPAPRQRWIQHGHGVPGAITG